MTKRSFKVHVTTYILKMYVFIFNPLQADRDNLLKGSFMLVGLIYFK